MVTRGDKMQTFTLIKTQKVPIYNIASKFCFNFQQKMFHSIDPYQPVGRQVFQ